MINENFVYFGALLSLLGGGGYLIETLKGRVKPNRVTWFFWALAPLIAFFAQIKQGVGILAMTTFMAGFVPLLIFTASFVNKKAYWNLTKFDIGCGIFAAFGLIGWIATRNGNVAILFGILADGLAALPTLVKGYKAPLTEDYRLFLLGASSASITLLAITKWTFEYYAFPLYLLIITLMISAAILIGRKKKNFE